MAFHFLAEPLRRDTKMSTKKLMKSSIISKAAMSDIPRNKLREPPRALRNWSQVYSLLSTDLVTTIVSNDTKIYTFSIVGLNCINLLNGEAKGMSNL